MGEDRAADACALVLVEEFRVVHAGKRGFTIEHHTGGDDRPGKAAAPDFVRARNRPKTKIAEPAFDFRHLGKSRKLREEWGETRVGVSPDRERLVSADGVLRYAPLSP
jgi:hypothetical protein